MGSQCEDCAPAELGGQNLPDRFSDVFALLGDTNRRLALHCLAEQSHQPISVSELADRIVSVRDGEASADPDSIEVELRHRHLPRLKASGIVSYDARSEAVVYHGDPILTSCLEKVEPFDPTPEY